MAPAHRVVASLLAMIIRNIECRAGNTEAKRRWNDGGPGILNFRFSKSDFEDWGNCLTIWLWIGVEIVC